MLTKILSSGVFLFVRCYILNTYFEINLKKSIIFGIIHAVVRSKRSVKFRIIYNYRTEWFSLCLSLCCPQFSPFSSVSLGHSSYSTLLWSTRFTIESCSTQTSLLYQVCTENPNPQYTLCPNCPSCLKLSPDNGTNTIVLF